MSSASGPVNPTHITLTAEQFQSLLANTRPPPGEDRPVQLKPEKPPTFNGERTKLRSFLVLCRVYYAAMRITDNRTNITFTETLFRGPAANWLTLFTEEKKERTWTTYQRLEEILQNPVWGSRCGRDSTKQNRKVKTKRRHGHGILEHLPCTIYRCQHRRWNLTKMLHQRDEQRPTRCVAKSADETR